MPSGARNVSAGVHMGMVDDLAIASHTIRCLAVGDVTHRPCEFSQSVPVYTFQFTSGDDGVVWLRNLLGELAVDTRKKNQPHVSLSNLTILRYAL